MEKKKFKQYGRTKVNKYDWLLAISCVLISIGSLWLSLGICLVDAPQYALNAFMHFVRGLAFINDSTIYGQGAVASSYTTIICYISLLILVGGCIYLFKTRGKDRIPGLVAQFVAALGGSLFICLIYTYLSESPNIVNSVWPSGLITITSVLFFNMFYSIYLVFLSNPTIKNEVWDDNYKEKEEEFVPVYEEIVEEEKEPEPQEEEITASEEEEKVPEEEEVEEPTEEEPVKEENEPIEAENVEIPVEEVNDPYGNLGKRRKRIPFENKMKRSKQEMIDRYNTIVNALREYDFNDRLSIPGETFSFKKERLIFLTFSGETLKVYFKLNPKDYEESTIPVKNVSEVKKYEDIPSCLIIKSDLAARRAVMLGEKVANDNNIKKK